MPDETDARSIITASPFGGLEETTRTSLNYVDEDYPARPDIKQSLRRWGDDCGSESSTLETDVCVWRYAPLVVHATQEEEEKGHSDAQSWTSECPDVKNYKSRQLSPVKHRMLYSRTSMATLGVKGLTTMIYLIYWFVLWICRPGVVFGHLTCPFIRPSRLTNVSDQWFHGVCNSLPFSTNCKQSYFATHWFCELFQMLKRGDTNVLGGIIDVN